MLMLAELLTATLHLAAGIIASTHPRQAGGIADLVHVQRRDDEEEAGTDLAQSQNLDHAPAPRRNTSRTAHPYMHADTQTHVHVHTCTHTRTHAHTHSYFSDSV